VGGEAPERPLARQQQRCRGVAKGVRVVGEGGDVLAEAVVAGPVQPDLDRQAHHAAGHLGGEAFELVALDDEREVGQPRPE
jgi:hypothetical protein